MKVRNISTLYWMEAMGKIVDLFGLADVKGRFGLEIECEGNNLPLLKGHPWISTDDGSLRGVFPHSRNEYILNKPLDLPEAVEAIAFLNKQFEEHKSELNFSFRTSVHVHANMQQLDEVQVLNVIYLYMLMEPSLVEYCGEGRKANRFCLRLQDADGLYDLLSQIFVRGLRYVKEYREDAIRYSSLNLAPLYKYGSVEFRAMRGTSDPAVLVPWLNVLNCIIEKATQPRTTPVSIRKEFVDKGVEKFLVDIVGEELFKQVFNKDFEHDVNLAHSLTLDLPFLFQQSPYIKAKEVKPKAPKQKILGDLLIHDDVVMPAPEHIIRDYEAPRHEEIVRMAERFVEHMQAQEAGVRNWQALRNQEVHIPARRGAAPIRPIDEVDF